MIKHIFAFLSGFVSIFLFSACNKDNTFTIGQELVDVKTNVMTVDTSTLVFYTFKQDSLITSNSGKALVGSYNDENLGHVTSSTYFQIGLPTLNFSTIIDSSAGTPKFDSLALTIHYSHYFYGDTTKPYTIEVRRLKDKLDTRVKYNGYYYNNADTTGLYYPYVLGSKSKIVRPARKDSIQIRLTDDLGKELFQKMRRQTDPKILNNTFFADYFKGFALMSPANENSLVMGFYAGNDSMYMTVYYHSGDVRHFTEFKSINPTYQFNLIASNRDLLPLNSLKKYEDKVSSVTSGMHNQSYVQAGTGIMTRIDLPYLRNLLNLNTNTAKLTPNIKILSAKLYLYPVPASYNTVPLPSSLTLYQLDNINNITGTFLNSQGNALTPSLYINDGPDQQTYYVFDITSYVASEILLTTNDIPSLGLSLPAADNNSTLKRVILGDGSRILSVPKLKILYWRY